MLNDEREVLLQKETDFKKNGGKILKKVKK